MSSSSQPTSSKPYGQEEAQAFAKVVLHGPPKDINSAALSFLFAINPEYAGKVTKVITHVNEAFSAIATSVGNITPEQTQRVLLTAALVGGLAPFILPGTTEEVEEESLSVEPSVEPSVESAPASVQESAPEPARESGSESAQEPLSDSPREHTSESALGDLSSPEHPSSTRRLVRLQLTREPAFIGTPGDWHGPLYGRSIPLPHGPSKRPYPAWPAQRKGTYRARMRSPDAADIKQRAKHIAQLLGSGLHGRLPSPDGSDKKDGSEGECGDSISSAPSPQTTVIHDGYSSPASSVAPSPVSCRKRSREPEDEDADASTIAQPGTPKSTALATPLRDDGSDPNASLTHRKISCDDLSYPCNPELPAPTPSRKRSREPEDEDANALSTSPAPRAGSPFSDGGNPAVVSSITSRDDGRDSDASQKRRKISGADHEVAHSPKTPARSPAKPRPGRLTRSYTMASFKMEE